MAGIKLKTDAPIVETKAKQLRVTLNPGSDPADPRKGAVICLTEEPEAYRPVPPPIAIAASDESTPLEVNSKATVFRTPYSMKLATVKASLTTPQTGGSIVMVDVKADGQTIFSTPLTFDNGESTTKTATTPVVLSTTQLADDQEIEIAINQVGDGTATDLKVYLIGAA